MKTPREPRKGLKTRVRKSAVECSECSEVEWKCSKQSVCGLWPSKGPPVSYLDPSSSSLCERARPHGAHSTPRPRSVHDPSYRSVSTATTMSLQLNRKYKLASSDQFDEYMKAMGEYLVVPRTILLLSTYNTFILYKRSLFFCTNMPCHFLISARSVFIFALWKYLWDYFIHLPKL